MFKFLNALRNSIVETPEAIEEKERLKKEQALRKKLEDYFVVNDIELQKLKYFEGKILLVTNNFSRDNPIRILMIIKKFHFKEEFGARYLSHHEVIESPDVDMGVFQERVYTIGGAFSNIQAVINKLHEWEKAYGEVVKMQEFQRKIFS